MEATPFELPAKLPAPIDDGAAAHLQGMAVPQLSLPSTSGQAVDLAALQGLWVIYLYPMTGRPGVPLPEGWDAIPGARGCTPQSCSYRDHHAELQALGTQVLGLSTQSTEYQREARDRLHLPFEILSDEALKLSTALRLPTFVVEGKVLLKRLTLIIQDQRIIKVFYPVFPSDRNVHEVLAWLHQQAGQPQS